MGLSEYRTKRDFDSTSEPSGADEEAKQAGCRFVVQKHHASRLHYDLRLELDGVLKSWAVPKGPSMDPDDRRLAVMVEDHPLDYAEFEVVIGEGNYGAGTVIVWDAGTYSAPEDMDAEAPDTHLRQGLRRGKVSLTLHGEKLRGEFSLVKMNDDGDNAWLLIKKDDSFADSSDVLDQDRSVLTGRTLREISESAGERSGTREDIDLSGAERAEMPQDVSPMLAREVEEPFDRPGWVFEIKWDGYRTIAEVSSREVKLYSRTGQSFTALYEPVVDALRDLDHEAVIDGEVVVLDAGGEPRFQMLQNYWRGVREGKLVYYAFDLLWLDGHDLQGLPLTRRKELLQKVLPPGSTVRYSDHVDGRGEEFFELASRRELEGIMAKDGESPYRQGVRSSQWLKVKTRLEREAVIAGFTEPRGGRKRFGALVLGIYDAEGELRYVGHVGTGFSDRSLANIHRRLTGMAREESPFAQTPRTNEPATWVKPELVCEVEFREWTDDGRMRRPVFKRLREDLDPLNVRLEAPPPQEPQKPSPAGEEKAELTNLQKVYWPREGYTKGDLIDYYRAVAPAILPYLVDRPQSLHRHPDGIEGESFFQKDVGDMPPEWVPSVRIHSESQDKDIDYLVCRDEDTLLYMANLGCIEINPWSSRVSALDHPDYLVLDLDPTDAPFEDVIACARKAREILQGLDIPCYCKTSGGRGLHVTVPLGARYDYEQARTFAHLIARMVNRALPDVTSLERAPDRRRGKVYLDYLQNRRGQTIVVPYSVRPRPGATVSTPLRWFEVESGLDPKQFTIETVLSRLEAEEDPYRPVLGSGIDMSQALERLGR